MVRLGFVHIAICTCMQLFCSPQTLIPLLSGHGKQNMGLQNSSIIIPSSSSKGWWGKVPTWLQCTALFSQGCLPWRFHGSNVLPHYTDYTALWGKGEKQQRNGLCRERLGRRWWSLSWSFMLLWTRLAGNFSPGDHIYSYSRDVRPAVLLHRVCFLPVYFISLGAGHRLWKGDTKNGGLSWCHRCKWESLPGANLKLLGEISCC